MKKTLKSIFYQVIVTAMMFVVNTTYAQQFKVVGYIPNWGAGPALISTMDYSKVTHINYSFLNPIDGSGTLDTWNPGLTELVTKAHAANVKVLVAIGGAGTSYDATLRNRWFSVINPANRGNFINNLSNFVTANNLDGIDIDIEGDGINGDYDGFVIALANALHAKGKLVTAALKSDYGNPNLVNTSLPYLDFANIMCYDQVGPWTSAGQHSAFNYSTNMIEYWKGRGFALFKNDFWGTILWLWMEHRCKK